jgi:hypothetical protein
MSSAHRSRSNECNFALTSEENVKMEERRKDGAQSLPTGAWDLESLGPGILNRRSFMERASVAVMGVASADRILPVGTTSQPSAGLPDALGRGFLSTGQAKALMADLQASEPGRENNASISFARDMVWSRSAFAKSVAGSARAKFGSGPFSVKGSVSASEDFRSQRNTLHLVLAKRVTTEDVFLRDPTLSKEAAREKAPLLFVGKYGDHVVRKVTMGGELVIVYTLQYEREDQASSVSAKISGKWRGGSGGADFHSFIKSQSEAASMSMRGYCRGVRAMPSLIANNRAAQTAGGAATKDAAEIDELLKFWDRFDEMVRRDGVPTLVAFELMPVHELRKSPTVLRGNALLGVNRVIAQCEELDDLIDGRMAELRYLKEKCLSWNPHVPVASIDASLGSLAAQGQSLRQFVQRLSVLQDVKSFDQPVRPPFELRAVQTIPDNWICRDLRQIASRDWGPFVNTGEVAGSLALPKLADGQHIRIAGQITKYGGDRLSLSLKFNTGQVVGSWNVANAGRNVDQIVQVPKGASSLAIQGSSYGGDPSYVRLVAWG